MLNTPKLLLVLRGALAALTACAAVFCLFRTSEPDFWNNRALAQAEAGDAPKQTVKVLPEQQRLELKYSLQTLAAALSAGFGGLSEQDQAKALAERLNELFPQLRDKGYFTLWSGSTALCSPLTPDVEGQNFNAQRDANGVLYIRSIGAAAEKGGGFTEFSLKKSPGDSVPARYVCYSAPVYGAPFHLSVWAAVQTPVIQSTTWPDIRRGYFFSGLSLAGLVFILLPPAGQLRAVKK